MKVFAWIAYCAAIGFWLAAFSEKISFMIIAGIFLFGALALMLQMYEGVP